MSKSLQILTKGISLLLFVIVWSSVANYIDNSIIFPGIYEVGLAIQNIVSDGNFITILSNTLVKLISVMVFVIFASSLLAVLSFRYRIFRELITPYISIIKAIPTVVLIIIVLIWYDAKVVPIIATVVIVLPILYDNILNGIMSIDKNLIKMSTIFRVSRKRSFLKLYLPAVYYDIAGGIHSLIGLAFKVIIAGEILSQEDMSIGGEILLNKMYLEGANVFAWVIIVILLNFLIEKIVVILNNKLMSWR